MNLKKIALKGLIILFVVIFLCMFFGKTLQTITTAKVKTFRASQGRFEEKMTFDANVHFPETTEFVVEDAVKSPIIVDKVHVKPGHWVNEGDTIFTAKLSTLDNDYEALRKEYDEKARALIDLDIPNRKLSKQSAQNDLYTAMLDSQDALSDAMFKARSAAQESGTLLSGDVTNWSKELSAAKDMPDDAKKIVQLAIAAKGVFDDARTAFFNTYENKKLKLSKETFDYINARNKLIDEMDEITGKMVALDKRSQDLTRVKATQAGYVVSLGVAPGEAYDGIKAAYTLSAKDVMPVLRAVVPTDLKRAIEDGTRVEIPINDYTTERSKVQETTIAADGNKYLVIELPESMQGEGASAVRSIIANEGVEVTITYRAKQATVLLPASAVRGDSENAYVYEIQQDYGGFMGGSSMKVIKRTVTVLDRSDKFVSVADSMDYTEIADSEDRPLEDGQTVMKYVN